MADTPMPYTDHLRTAVRSIYIAIAGLLLCMSFIHINRESVVAFLLSPLGKDYGALSFLKPLEPLLFILKIDFVLGIILVLPLWILLLILFISPTLAFSWWKYLLLGGSISILTLIGLAYGYLIVVPIVLNFMQSLILPNMTMALTASGYINFLLATVLLLTVIFQIPILIIMGTALKLIKPEQITKHRKYVYSGIFIMAAIITPTTDVATLLLIAFPAIAVTELGCICSRILTFRSHQTN